MNEDPTRFYDPSGSEKLSFCDGFLVSSTEARYPIVNGIPRFVSSDNYSKDFGDQWKKFPKTQLDSYVGIPISEDRLNRCLNGELSLVKGMRVLEVGSGAGRFTEVLLKHGAIVDSLDYSNAVEVNAINNGSSDRLTLVQGDIRSMPFLKEGYDYVVCLGVLQHTPDPEEGIEKLFEMLRPGGAMAIDHYPLNWRIIWPTPIGESISLYRLITLALPQRLRFRFIKAVVDFWFPVHWLSRRSLLAHRILRRVSPVLFYFHDYKLRDRQMHYEWALLDTHDATTDFYKHRRTISQIKKSLQQLDAINIDVRLGGNGIEAFCRKKLTY